MGRIAGQCLLALSLAAVLGIAPGLAAPAPEAVAQQTTTARHMTTPKAAKPTGPATKTTASKPGAKHAAAHTTVAHKPVAKSAAKRLAASRKHPAERREAAAPKKPNALHKTASVASRKADPPKAASSSAAPVRTASHTVAAPRDNGADRTVRSVTAHGTTAPAAAAAPARVPAGSPAAAIAAMPAVAALTPTTAAAGTAARPESAQAAGFVADFLGEAFRIARLAGTTALQRWAQLADLFNAKMDVGGIAVTTTTNQLNATTADVQRRFRSILVSYLVETYYPRIELASGTDIKVETTAGTPLPDGTAVVWTTFSKSGWGSQSVKWHLARTAEGYKIVDIISAGASLVQMERDTFASVMRYGGLPELMAKLDARTKALATAEP